MQLTNKSPIKTSIGAEIYTRLLIGLFMFLCFILAKKVLKPIDDGDVKLIMTGLIEIAMMVILAIFSGRSGIVRDMNELNCYALLTHLTYLPAFYLDVMPTFHNNAINLILFLVIARLIYFGPRTDNGDFKGLPVFGLLGHIQSIIDEKRNSKLGRFFNHLPSVLFFGSSIPIWIIIARSNDLIITSSIIGLMLFIFAMAQRIHNLLEAAHYKDTALEVKDIPLAHPKTAPANYVVLNNENALIKFTAQAAISNFSLQVIETFKRVVSENEYGLTPVNLHIIRSMPEMPRPYEPPMSFDIDSQRIGALDNLDHLGKIIWRQRSNELPDKRNTQVFESRLQELTNAFENKFSKESNAIDIDKYAYIGSQAGDFEMSDDEFFHVCEILMMAKMKIILKNDAALLDKMDVMEKIETTLNKKFWPDN